MINPNKNNLNKGHIANCLVLVCALFLSACDGGIFGTGGADDPIIPDAQSPNASGSDMTEADAGLASTDAGSDAGFSDAGASDAGGSDSGTSDAGSSDAGSTEDGSTDAGATPGTAGDTGGTNNLTTSGLPPISMITGGTSHERFENNTATVIGPGAWLSLVNITSRTLNTLETSVDPHRPLFSPEGVAPGAQSETIELSNTLTSLTIVDTDDTTESLVTYPEFEAIQASLTTIIVREAEQQVSAVTLITETQASDPSLSGVRVVQAGTLGADVELTARLQLNSAGDNPGGMDFSLGPISYSNAQTDYAEVPAGQYELIDSQSRLSPQLLTFAGGSNYTIVLYGNETSFVALINDSLATP